MSMIYNEKDIDHDLHILETLSEQLQELTEACLPQLLQKATEYIVDKREDIITKVRYIHTRPIKICCSLKMHRFCVSFSNKKIRQGLSRN